MRRQRARSSAFPSLPAPQERTRSLRAARAICRRRTRDKATPAFRPAASGDVSFSRITETTQAFIDDKGRIVADSIDLVARNDSLELSAAGSAAIGTGDGSTNVGIAGSYGEVDLLGATRAYIKRAQVQVVGDLGIRAERTGHAFSLVAGGLGRFALSGHRGRGSAAVNRMSQDTSVALDTADIEAGGNVTLSSVDALSMSVVAGALSFGRL